MAHHEHDRRFHHHHAQRLDDPERAKWLPVGDLLTRLSLHAGAHALDVGTGTGYFALPIARAVRPGGRVWAVDVQPEMLELLRPRVEPDLPIELVCADATATTLADGCADLALYANVWHELDAPDAALVEAARVLRADGRIAILDWRADVEGPPGPKPEHRVSVPTILRTLEGAGWSIDASEPFARYHHLSIARPPRA